MGDILDLSAARASREAQKGIDEYAARLKHMDRLELLEEMVRFQEERSLFGTLTAQMCVRGHILFKMLEIAAETHELRLLTSSYRKHLVYEAEHTFGIKLCANSK